MDLWDRKTDTIIDVKLGDADVGTYRFEWIENILALWEKMKKDKQSKNCHNQRKHFSLFVIYVDGIIGKEALVVLSNLSRLMAVKTDETIPHVRGWINGRISIAVARSYSKMIHRDRLHSTLRDQYPDWDPELGLGLAQSIVHNNNFTHTSARSSLPSR